MTKHKVVKARRANLPKGVNWELSPVFDVVRSPWKLMPDMLRLMTVVHQLERFCGLSKTRLRVRRLKLVDLGCGFGEIGALLQTMRLGRNQRVDYTGYDVDHDKLAIGRELSPSRKLELADLTQFSLAPRSVDIITSSEVLEHLTEKDGLSSQFTPVGGGR